ncbi:MAG: hypothetical protein IPG04_42680 [Polyangiaceae bacterium]|jgi:hypothetical protein|nr:hypothetical protein [Polyangiaceae bacterium]
MVRRAGSSEPLGYHVTMRLHDSRVIARTAGMRRVAARTLVAVGAPRGLAAFSIADTHLHLLCLASRRDAGALARVAGVALSKRLALGARFDPSRFVAISDQAHLASAFFYVLRQQQRHGLANDATHDGSILPDLLGWRLLGEGARQCVARMASHLPRVRAEDLTALVELGSPDRAVASRALADAAAAAFGLATARGRAPAAVRARRAAVHVGMPLGLSTADLARLLETTQRSVQRLARERADAGALRAVTWQLRLRASAPRGLDGALA